MIRRREPVLTYRTIRTADVSPLQTVKLRTWDFVVRAFAVPVPADWPIRPGDIVSPRRRIRRWVEYILVPQDPDTPVHALVRACRFAGLSWLVVTKMRKDPTWS